MNWIDSFKKYRKEYRAHALDRMVQRDISFNEIDEIHETMKVIAEYPDDKPYPACLSLGFTKGNKPIHIVFSINKVDEVVFIISLYEPDNEKWTENFERRKK